MKVFIVLCLAALCSSKFVAKRSQSAHFDVYVTEKSAKFVQEIDADLEKNQVVYKTPEHNDVQETLTLQDFNKGHEVFCFPKKAICHLIPLNRSQFPDPAALESSMLKLWQESQGSMSDKDTQTIAQKWFISEGPIENLSFLSKDMQHFVAGFGFPLYRLERVPEDAEFIDADEPSPVHRQKRSGFLTQLDNAVCNDTAEIAPGIPAPAKWKYAMTANNGCDWIFTCGKTPTGETVCPGREHIRNAIFFTCLCCPTHQRLSECFYCVKMHEV